MKTPYIRYSEPTPDRPTGPATLRRLSDEDKRVLRWWAEREVADGTGYHEVAPWKIVALLDEAAEQKARILAALPGALQACDHGSTVTDPMTGPVPYERLTPGFRAMVDEDAAALAAAIEKTLEDKG